MEFSANDIAALLNGEVEGNGSVKVSSISKIDQSLPGTLTFLSNPAYTKHIYTTSASIVIVNKDFRPDNKLLCTLIRVDDSYAALAKLLDFYVKTKPVKVGIEQPCFISSSAILGEQVYIGAFAYIGHKALIGNNVKIYPHVYIGDNVKVGDDSILYSGVKVYAECSVGSSCIIHSGVVIGSDGFGFAPNPDGTYTKIEQIGNVIIEDNVEIGANSTIDRSTMGSTILHKSVKLDNLVHIAHNVEIGENTVMAAQGGVAGSTIIGKCERDFTTGTALISKVLRVESSKVLMPRSHKITLKFPPARIYSADINSSLTVDEYPRFKRTGFLVSPTSFKRLKFCILRAPIWKMSVYFSIISTSRVSMTSVTILKPVSFFALARYLSPFKPRPWKA